MSLVGILIALIILGLIWWLVQTYILSRVAEPFRTIVIVVMVVIVIIYPVADSGRAINGSYSAILTP
jgi:hypothetical protein